MRAARGVLSAFLSMALVVGMVPDCAYAKVAARALRLGAYGAQQGGAGGASSGDGAPSPASEGASSDESSADADEAADAGEVAVRRERTSDAIFVIPDQPVRTAALGRRGTVALLSEELRRLDPDTVLVRTLDALAERAG